MSVRFSMMARPAGDDSRGMVSFGLDESLAAGKIERVNFEQAAGGIEQREAGVVVMNDALERGDDAAK